MKKVITLLDAVRFIIAFSVYLFLYIQIEGYFLALMQKEELSLILLVKRFFLVEGIGNLVALFISLILISRRYKVVAGTLIMFASLIFYLLFVVILNNYESWVGLAANIVGLSFVAVGTSAAILAWMFINTKLKSRIPVFKIEAPKIKSAPKTSLLLILLSLASVPATYVTMCISAFITLGVCLWLLVIVLQLPRIPVWILIALGFAPLVSIWVAFRAIKAFFFSKPDFQTAIPLDLSNKVRLKALIEEVCAKIKTKIPDVVILHADPTFFVTESKMQTYGGIIKGRILAIGAPLIRQLSFGELKVILAHEFAHFSGKDTAYSRFVVPVYKTLGTAINDIVGINESNKGDNNAMNLVNLLLLVPGLFLRIFLTYFATIDNILSRSRELRADWIAALNFGSNNMVSGLTKVIQISRHYSESAESIGHENNNYFEKYDGMLVSDAKKIEEYRQKALLETEQEFDTHPSLATRVENLPYQVMEEAGSTKIEEIRSEITEDEKKLSSYFQQMIKDFKEYHEKAEKFKQEFNLLNDIQMTFLRSITTKLQKELRLSEDDVQHAAAFLIIAGDVPNNAKPKINKIVDAIKKNSRALDIFLFGTVIRINLLSKYGLNQDCEKMRARFNELAIDLSTVSQKEIPSLEVYAGMANDFLKS